MTQNIQLPISSKWACVRRSFSFMLFWICISVGLGQALTVDLSGKVVDSAGVAIVNANVQLLESALSVKTDAQGAFTLQGTFSNGVIHQSILPGGFKLHFRNGILQLENLNTAAITLDWMSINGNVRSVTIQPKSGKMDVSLEKLFGKMNSDLHFLRIRSPRGTSTFRTLKSEKGESGLESLLSARVGAASATENLVVEVSATGFLTKRFALQNPVQANLKLSLLLSAVSLKQKIQDFLGPGQSMRVAFLKKEAGVSKKYFLNYVDLAEMNSDTMPVHTFADSHGPTTSPFGAFGPSWSPDGKVIAYEVGFENLTTNISRIYLQPIQGARKDGPGIPSTNPRWWTNGMDTTLIWCTSGGQSGWADTNSKTLRQKYSHDTLIGTSELLAKGSYNAGLSMDEKYLATAYPYGVMLNRTTGEKHFLHIYPNHPKAKDGSNTDSLQVCNGSISRDSSHSDRMLFLDFGVPEAPTYDNGVLPAIYAQHRMILLGDYTAKGGAARAGRIVDFIDSPASEIAKGKTWDDPEWTNQADFAVATTRDPNGDLTNPSEPLPTQPDIYLIKISTKESLKIYTGTNQTLPVVWIGTVK